MPDERGARTARVSLLRNDGVGPNKPIHETLA